MTKKYQIGVGKQAWFWESNIIPSATKEFILPLRLEELKSVRVKEDFNRKERIFVLEDLNESQTPPHEIGNVVYFTEKQAKDIIKRLQQFLQEKQK